MMRLRQRSSFISPHVLQLWFWICLFARVQDTWLSAAVYADALGAHLYSCWSIPVPFHTNQRVAKIWKSSLFTYTLI